MSKLLSRIGLVSVLTLISRVLGLARDMLVTAAFGATIWNSAFITAFTLPNLFRRLLGEGALTAALMPNLSEELEARGRAAVFNLVNKTLSWLLLICSILVVTALLFLYSVTRYDVSENWMLGSRVGILLFPYLILICLAAIISAVLNLFGKFGVPALTAVWLNCCILLFLGGFGWHYGDNLAMKMLYLCLGVIVGGSLQLAAPTVALMREGWRPRLDFEVSPRLRDVMLLTLPGVYGAAAYQVNIMVSRGLAFYVNESGATLLYLANRLVELPLGLFTIAISTVIFPALSRAIASKNDRQFSDTYRNGIMLSTLMTIPSAVGLCLLSREIISVLFERGMFHRDDTASLVPVLYVFAMGMPFYSFVAIETRAFFSIKDTKTPVKAATWALGINGILSAGLMIPFETLGLAMASNLSIIFQCFYLHNRLRKQSTGVVLQAEALEFIKILIGGVLMGVAVWWGIKFLNGLNMPVSWQNLAKLAALIPTGAIVYFASLYLMNLRLLRDLLPSSNKMA